MGRSQLISSGQRMQNARHLWAFHHVYVLSLLSLVRFVRGGHYYYCCGLAPTHSYLSILPLPAHWDVPARADTRHNVELRTLPSPTLRECP